MQEIVTPPAIRRCFETRFTFDDQGRQLTRTLPLGFGPDGVQGTADDAILPEGAFTERFAYDNMGRQVLHVSFEGVVTQTIYDASTGHRSQQRYFASEAAYANGAGTPTEIWTYRYDAFGREVEVTQSAGVNSRVQTTQYDAEGRIARITSPEGILAYEYDNLGQKTRTLTLDPTVLATGGSVTQATLEATSFGYDTLGRLQSVTVTRRLGVNLATPEITRYGYDLVGNLIRQDNPNGVITVYQYDSLNRLDTLTHYRGVGPAPANDTDLSDNPKLAEFDYTVTANGQRTALAIGTSKEMGLDGYLGGFHLLGRFIIGPASIVRMIRVLKQRFSPNP